ncbi:MAG: hypothetical protein GY861_11910, partial [bacterium]|nr:hypothetical protein [bacterium]
MKRKPYNSLDQIQCYKCQSYGHLAQNCKIDLPVSPVQLIRHRLIEDVNLSEEEFENEEGSSCSKDYDQKKEARRHESKVLPCYTKADIVTVCVARKYKCARAFMDSGAQVCIITKRFAKLLEPTVRGVKYKFICIGHK